MADRAARYLNAHPDQSLIIIAGSGHLAYRSGIPRRLEKRLPVKSALVLQIDEISGAAWDQGADFLLLSRQQSLPAAGRMGIALDLTEGVRAQQVLPGSAAEKAGILDADHILSINDQPIETLSDLRLALLDKKPGDRINVGTQRAGESLAFVLTLQ